MNVQRYMIQLIMFFASATNVTRCYVRRVCSPFLITLFNDKYIFFSFFFFKYFSTASDSLIVIGLLIFTRIYSFIRER